MSEYSGNSSGACGIWVDISVVIDDITKEATVSASGGPGTSHPCTWSKLRVLLQARKTSTGEWEDIEFRRPKRRAPSAPAGS